MVLSRGPLAIVELVFWVGFPIRFTVDSLRNGHNARGIPVWVE